MIHVAVASVIITVILASCAVLLGSLLYLATVPLDDVDDADERRG